MNPDDIHVGMASNPKYLCAVRALVRAYVIAEGLGPDRAEEVVLAVDEACTNAIRHAYGGRPDGRLELDLRTDGAGIEIVLTDRGRPAPANCLPTGPMERPDPDSVKPGGLGMHIIRRVFDEAYFEPGDLAGNRLVMKLKRRETSGEDPRQAGGTP